MTKFNALWYADVLSPVRRVAGRRYLTIGGHILRLALIVAFLLALPAVFGDPGWGGSAAGLLVVSRPTGRSIFALIGWFPLSLYGTVGNGSADDTTGILNALGAAGAAGGVVMADSGRNYKFTAQLAIPDGVTFRLGMGTFLTCAVTSGVDAITLGKNAMLCGSGGGGAGGSGGALGSSVITTASTNVGAVVTNRDHDIQEYAYIRDIYMEVAGGGTVRSLVDFVSLFATSGLTNVVLNGGVTATNCLRIRGGPTASGCGTLSFINVWMLRPTQDACLIEGKGAAGGGGGNVVELWFASCLFESWGDGFYGCKMIATTGASGLVSDPHFAHCHFETALTYTLPSGGILADHVVGLVVDHSGFVATTTANLALVTYTNASENQGGYIMSFRSNQTLATLLIDNKRGVTIANDNTIDFYMPGGRSSGNFHLPKVFRTLTYGTTVNTDARQTDIARIVPTDTVAFTIATPTNPIQGDILTYDIFNNTAGAIGAITWSGAFKRDASFANPAAGKHRLISFTYDGTSWLQMSPSTSDI